jgi:PBP1b-binding outer membrane lipoprotein LpoB
MKKIIVVLFILSLFVTGCIGAETEKLEEYDKCNSVCSSVLSEDFVTLELCREECKKKFLDSD